MSGWRRHPEGDALAPPGGGGDSRPLNLIHTNNCSNPVSMRVPGRFAVLLIKPARWVLYRPVEAIKYLPGSPLRYLWLVRLVVTIDTPLRRAYLGRPLYAKSTG